MDTVDACKIVRAHVGDNVGRLCHDKGLSQTTFANMVGIDRSHLNRLIRGRNNVTLDVLVKIADGLNVPLTDLFFGLDDAPPRCLVEYDAQDGTAGDPGKK